MLINITMIAIETVIPPFYTDCGKNICVGENVYINTGYTMQDQWFLRMCRTIPLRRAYRLGHIND